MEPRPFKRAKRFVRYLLLRAVYFLAGLLPLPWALRAGSALGRLAFALAGSQRRKALASLAIAFPEKSEPERAAIARESFEHLATMVFEICCFGQIDPQLESYVEFGPEDHAVIDQVLAEGKGAVWATGHVGNFDLMARRVARDGYPSHTVAKVASDPRLTAFIDKIRGSGKLNVVWRGKGTSVWPELTRIVTSNEMVGFLIDQDIKTPGFFVDFFGRPAWTPRGPADLALRTGSAVLAGFGLRKPGGGHRVQVTRIPIPRTGDAEADARTLTQAMTTAVELAIRQDPAAWPWIHQRWKTRPAAAEQPTEPLQAVSAGVHHTAKLP